jgi:hypothetical protein
LIRDLIQMPGDPTSLSFHLVILKLSGKADESMRFSRHVNLDSPEIPSSGSNSEVVEICLLLPGWQASKLEQEAHHRGLTTAQMVRHVLCRYLERE